MIINIIALLVALTLSGVAGWYSIIGLTAIFSASFWPIVIMGSTLEVGKVVTASWLYRNWHIAPRLLKYYLTGAVCVLMFITSMGIFGFLSKAHIEQQLSMSTGAADQIAIIDGKLEIEQSKIKDFDTQILQIDNALTALTQKGQAKTALAEAKKQRAIRDELVKQKDAQNQLISDLKTQRIKASTEVKKLEAEVGPLKYIAELIYTDADNTQLEKAVRWVIIIIVLVFDPLAVLLLIAANIGLQNRRPMIKDTDIPVVIHGKEIDEDSILKL